MSFTDARRKVVEALRNGNVFHVARKDMEEKNWLWARRISREEAAAIIEGTRGTQFSCSPYHQDPSVEVLVFRPSDSHIKCYLRNGVWFISFHKAGDES
ncbi:MAG: hypothetical protein ACYCW6_23870 [Candidatus Xenobia bacterium]